MKKGYIIERVRKLSTLSTKATPIAFAISFSSSHASHMLQHICLSLHHSQEPGTGLSVWFWGRRAESRLPQGTVSCWDLCGSVERWVAEIHRGQHSAWGRFVGFVTFPGSKRFCVRGECSLEGRQRKGHEIVFSAQRRKVGRELRLTVIGFDASFCIGNCNSTR